MLDEASLEYDLVILDAPPMLGFAEPLQMATAVDGVVVVARAGETPLTAVRGVIATLNRLRAKVVGVVLNEVHSETSRYYYYYGNYHKYYGAGQRKEPGMMPPRSGACPRPCARQSLRPHGVVRRTDL